MMPSDEVGNSRSGLPAVDRHLADCEATWCVVVELAEPLEAHQNVQQMRRH